jgi:hypothetical protein
MMWLCHGWGRQPPQTASHIHIRHKQSDWAQWYAVHWHTVAALHSFTYLTQIWGFWVTCGVKMMWLCHGWGWWPPQTASHIHITCIQSFWAHWYAVHWHMVAALNSFTYLAQIWGFWVTCGVKMMSLCHGWGGQPPQTASHIHIRHAHSIWGHWYADHRHIVVAVHIYTHPTWLRFWGSGSLVESKWCHYVIVEADSHLKLHPTSILDMHTVFEHIDMLSMGIW